MQEARTASLRELSVKEHELWNEVEAIVYLSGVAHNKSNGDDSLFDQVNHLQMMDVFKGAYEAGIRKFIYVSSIGVHGRYQPTGSSDFDEKTPYISYNAYSKSKIDAEKSLMAVDWPDVSICIIRPPMVYGKDAPANFKLLRKLVLSGIPIPLGGIKNRRNFIGVRNLSDFMAHLLLCQPRGKNIYVVSDGPSVSTSDFVGQMQIEIFGKKRLIPFDQRIASMLLRSFGRLHLYHQLWGDLSVQTNKVKSELGWTAPFTWQEELSESLK